LNRFSTTKASSCALRADEALFFCKVLHKFYRVLKTDLGLRPIYHKKDESAMAHLHLGILAYWVVNTIRYQLMNTQKAVTTLAQNKADEVIMIRKCSEPNEKVKAIYDKLHYRHTPFKKKKFVVHKTELKKPYLAHCQ
jgi:hypothetical protein